MNLLVYDQTVQNKPENRACFLQRAMVHIMFLVTRWHCLVRVNVHARFLADAANIRVSNIHGASVAYLEWVYH